MQESIMSPYLDTEKNIDLAALTQFLLAMVDKMNYNREVKGRNGWWDKEKCSNKYLTSMLIAHVKKGDPLDVAILAMMIHQRGERIGETG